MYPFYLLQDAWSCRLDLAQFSCCRQEERLCEQGPKGKIQFCERTKDLTYKLQLKREMFPRCQKA